MSDASQRDVSTGAAGASAPVAARPTTSAANTLRRRFLMAFGVGAAGAVGAATVPALASAAAVTQPAAALPAASGYRETEHVRDYYASTRI